MNITSSIDATNSTKAGLAEIRIAGKTLYAPSAEICGRTVVVTGNWLRQASIKDEDVVEGEIVADPSVFVEELKRSALHADIFSFSQKIPDTTPKYGYQFEWDNSAVIPLTSFDDWWKNRLSQETRRNVRRSAKRGVVVRPVEFDDELVRGIQAINNETPIRQGRRSWHFGKDFETVKMENGTYLERSDFLGAYFNDELIGFAKFIYVDQIATLIHIISKIEHQDKRPTNALIAKAVEVSAKKGAKFLLYTKFIYDGDQSSPLTEFKRRNGFEEMRYPRYFVPLTMKGVVAVKLGLYKGLRRLIPLPLLVSLKSLRSRVYQMRYPSKEMGSDVAKEPTDSLSPSA
jgi:hypothetical protein